MAYSRHLCLGSLAIGYWWVLPVGHIATLGYAAETPEASPPRPRPLLMCVGGLPRWMGKSMPMLNTQIKSLKCDWIAREAWIHLELSTHCTKMICESCNYCPTQKPHAGSAARPIGQRLSARWPIDQVTNSKSAANEN